MCCQQKFPTFFRHIFNVANSILLSLLQQTVQISSNILDKKNKDQWDELQEVHSRFNQQSRPKVVETLELCLVFPSPLINVRNMAFFYSTKRETNHLIINIESGGKGELAWCPNSFVWDCSLPDSLSTHLHALHAYNPTLQLTQYIILVYVLSLYPFSTPEKKN